MSASRGPLRARGGERLPLLASASCHGAILFASILWGALNPPIDLGSPDEGGGGGIVAVQGVPINVVRSEEENPVANPSEHTVPAPQQRRRATELAAPEAADEPEAVPLEETARRESEQQQERSVGQRSARDSAPNQVNSSRGAAVNSPLFSGSPSGPGVGFGAKGGPFGSRFGAYAQILQQKVAREWRRALGQAAGVSSKPVVVSFRIRRDGTIDSIRVTQTSGNRSLDYSAHRAVGNANPLRPLPPALGRNSIMIEMHFQLK